MRIWKTVLPISLLLLLRSDIPYRMKELYNISLGFVSF